MYPIDSYIFQDYLFHFMLSKAFLIQSVKGDTRVAMPKINQTELNKIVVPLPPLEEQKAIVEQVNSLMALCDQLEQAIATQNSTQTQWMQSCLKAVFENTAESNEMLMAAEPEGAYESSQPDDEGKEDKSFLKRKLLASYIINQSLDDPHFGDTKFEKLLHLADYHILKRNLGQNYIQLAAGPYDNSFTFPFFQQVTKAKWFRKEKTGNLNRIMAGENQPKSTKTYSYFSTGELEQIDKLIDQFKKTNYEKPEIVSTLYAVWNNRIILNQPITDELLKEDFLAWDKQKARYKDRLDGALQWMRDNQFVPEGWGKVIEKKKLKDLRA